MTLLTIVSKQIWPHVLAVAHLKPTSLILLHSEDRNESYLPAQRIKKLIETTGLLPKGNVALSPIPHDDFSEIGRSLDALAASRKIDLNECVLNFTGGNKLMATAGFRWAGRRSVRACYLERGNNLIWFEPGEGEAKTRTERVAGDICNTIDPLPLLRCQLDASEVERDGEKITLSRKGNEISDADFFARVQNGNRVHDFLTIEGVADQSVKEGDALELLAAAVLLKLGVPQVRRSLRLKVKSGAGIPTRKPHAELDLLFNWSGRLWLVDCKDRKAPEHLARALAKCLEATLLPQQAKDLLRRIESELSIGQTKVLKEDLISMREMGGLLGQIVCLRKDELGEEVSQFARSQRIEVVLKRDLVSGLRALLFPNRPAAKADLADLATKFSP